MVSALRLFHRVRDMWPMTIPASEPSVYSKRFRIFDEVDMQIPDDDDWMKLANWAFYQSIGRNVKSIRAGSLPVNTRSVTFKEFDHWMIENLRDDAYHIMRKQYRRR